MSLILDALNRSRQEQQGNAVPGLSSEHYSPQQDAASGGLLRWLPWLGLALALAVILWLLLERGGSEVPAPPPVASAPAIEPSPVAQTKAPPVAPAPAPAPEPEVRTVAPVVPAVTAEPVATLARPAEKSPASGQDQAVAALYEQQARETGPEVATAQPAAQVEPAAAAEEEDGPIDIEAMVKRARQDLEESRLAEHPAPFIGGLSQQTKDSIPTIFYQRHDYSGREENSTVVLNGKTLRRGGQAAPGVKVEEILPDSVVLNHQGTQFRLKALNSWVNL